MGLSIHYDGKLKKETVLSELLNEVVETCETFNWHYEVFNDMLPRDNIEKMLFKNEIFGMAFTPPECETVFICFESDGTMRSPLWKMIDDDVSDDLGKINTTSVKTQHAGPETHKKIINLFKHLDKKYFSAFSMFDESNYWENQDDEELKEKMTITDKTIKLLEERFNTKKLEGEKFEEFIVRVYEQKQQQS